MSDKWIHLQFPQKQTIYFTNGSQRTLYNVVAVEEGKWTHILCDNGRGYCEVIVNPNNVLFVVVNIEENE